MKSWVLFLYRGSGGEGLRKTTEPSLSKSVSYTPSLKIQSPIQLLEMTAMMIPNMNFVLCTHAIHITSVSDSKWSLTLNIHTGKSEGIFGMASLSMLCDTRNAYLHSDKDYIKHFP